MKPSETKPKPPLFNPEPGSTVPLRHHLSWPAATHCFEQQSIWAVQAAMACQRPLLVRGEAGIGKSQLARAVAAYLKWPFLSHVVNARTEPEDLLYTFDAVARLAEAQIGAADPPCRSDDTGAPPAAPESSRLDVKRFVRPGPFWWAVNWMSARGQERAVREGGRRGAIDAGSQADDRWDPPQSAEDQKWTREKGCVLLIDEIDKADSDVPNALLESLGNHGFQVPLLGETIRPAGRDAVDGDPVRASVPLVMLTTNEDRELPAAFLRRCLVLHIDLGTEPEKFLVTRGREHFKDPQRLPDTILKMAAQLLLQERKKVRDEGAGVWKPGASEYLDVLRGLDELVPGDEMKQQEKLAQLAQFTFCKNSPATTPSR